MPIGKSLRDSFVAGLVLVTPLMVTVLVLRVLFGWTVGFVNPVVKAAGIAQYTANIELVAQLVTVAVLLGIVTVLGFLVKVGIGRRTISEIGKFVRFIPVFRTIYTSVRQVADSFVERSANFESVVFVEHPLEGTYRLGFLTGDSPDSLQDLHDEEVYNVYMPASPTPTNGALAMVRAEHVYDADLTVREGLRMLMTTGMATTAEEMEQKALTDVDETRMLEGNP